MSEQLQQPLLWQPAYDQQEYGTYGNVYNYDDTQEEQEIQEIEQGVVDINYMFKSLATIVTDQGQGLDNIEANMTRVDQNVEAGTEHLRKGAKNQRKSRRNLCILLFVLVAITAIVMVAVLVK